MQAKLIWKRFAETHDAEGLNDLRRDAILEMGIVMFVIAWVIMLASIGYHGRPQGLLVAACLSGGALGVLAFRQAHFRLALLVLMAAAIGAIACQAWLFPESAAQFYFPIVVAASSALVSSGWSVLGVATLASAAWLAVAWGQGARGLDYDQIISPVFLNYLTAFAVWLGSRQMRIALTWMRNSYARANDLLEQLRDERMRLAQTLKMLEDAYYRITKLNDTLTEARSAAEAARRLKAEFAANISHELRTPLNLIIGFSETMANAPETYAGVAWTPTLRGDIEQIYRSSRHLSTLIDDILDLSALEVRQLGLVIEEASLPQVIEEAAAVIHDLYRAKRLYLKIDTAPNLPQAIVDTTRIRQVLLNLLSNAIRFTRQGGVTVAARLADREIRVSVADTGIGIAPQDVGKVFEEFGQVDGATSRQHEGTGLGVPLSKRLVQLHGGRMWLESQPGVGTTFYFTVPTTLGDPRSRVSAEVTQTPIRPDAYLSGHRKVLLAIEPDPLLLRTIRRHMTAYEVMEVKDHADLPALIDFYQPVAVLVDVSGQPGLPTQPAWRAYMPADLPVIMAAMPGSLNSARALGIQNYLIKPISREQLLDAVECLEQTVRTILIVDDDPRLVDLLSRMLQSSGKEYQLLKAYGGREALALLNQQPVDLVLLDLIMPDLGGLDVLRAVKQEQALANLAVIVISAQPPEESGPPMGLFLQVVRPKSTSLTEMLTCLGGLMEVLPRREAPGFESSPESPEVPGGLPAS
jgi:signal transduction histidine kinase/DNA-binding response OmpR family regulator